MESESPQRKLAVILHADVVGSTALVHLDETVAHQRLRGAFQRFSKAIEAYGGVVREIRGDALVAEFSRASDAVEAAIAAQTKNTDHNAHLDDDIRPELRVGIALGEVVIADDTVTGPGIVLAQRLEGLAEAGGVCVSAAIREAVPSRLPFEYSDLGHQEAKGFEEPVHTYAVSLKPGGEIPRPESRRSTDTLGSDSAQPRRRWIAAGVIAVVVIVASVLTWIGPWKPEFEPAVVDKMAFPLPEKPSVAVLPFTNMSDDKEQDYFADGITEDIITDMSQLSGLFVVARHSVFPYKGQTVTIKRVAEELGVRYVVEGSVRRSKDELRITAQLIDATTGFHMWAERYDRNLADVFALQAEIASNIVNALEVTLTGSEQARLARRQTHNREAYEYFLRGKSYRQRRGREANAKAQELLEKSIELDPNFAAPHVTLAMTYFIDWAYHWSDDPANLDRGMELSEKAIALDAGSASGYSMLGWLLMYKRRFDESLANQRKALALDPNSAEVHMRLAVLLYLGGGSPDEAISLIKRGMRLDPRYGPPFPLVLGQNYYAARRHRDAVGALRESLHMNPELQPAHRWLAATYSEMGEEEKARDAIAEVLRISPRATIAGYRKRLPFKDQADLDRFLDALRNAGLPEN